MRTYDEIVENVVEATAAHRRRVKKIQQITAASAMCAACVFGLSVYMNLEPQQTLPSVDHTETQTVTIAPSSTPSGTAATDSSEETIVSTAPSGETIAPATDVTEISDSPETLVSGQSTETALPPESGTAPAESGTAPMESGTAPESVETALVTVSNTEMQVTTAICSVPFTSESKMTTGRGPMTEEPTEDAPPTEEGSQFEPTIPEIDNPLETEGDAGGTMGTAPPEGEAETAAQMTTTTTTTTSSVPLAGRSTVTQTLAVSANAANEEATGQHWLEWVQLETAYKSDEEETTPPTPETAGSIRFSLA